MTKWKYTRNCMLLNSQKNPHLSTVIINHLPLVTTWSSFWLVTCRRFRSWTINNLGIFKMNWDFRMLVFEDLKLGVTFEGKMSWSAQKEGPKKTLNPCVVQPLIFKHRSFSLLVSSHEHCPLLHNLKKS